MNARRPRTRYERARSRLRRQLRAELSSGSAQPGPVHPEDSALVKALTDPAADDGQAHDGIRADGLPAEHPESMVLELSPADEVGLAALSNDLWPHDEYENITADGNSPDGAS